MQLETEQKTVSHRRPEPRVDPAPRQPDALAAAHLAVQVAIAVEQFHHPRARELQRRVSGLVREAGLHQRPEWRSLLSAFEVFARELTAHMKEEEEQVLDHLQFLMVRGQLVPGALRGSAAAWQVLLTEHDTMQVLRRRLERELDATVALQAQPGAPVVRGLMREFVTAFVEHHDFEHHALAPVLSPFLSEDG